MGSKLKKPVARPKSRPSIYKVDECPACKNCKLGQDFATGELFCLKCGLVLI